MGPRLTEDVFTQLCSQGYAIVPRYFPEEQRAAMAQALRRLLKPWEQVRDEPPPNSRDAYYFPYPEQVLNQAILDREAIAFARRWLGTDHIQYRPGLGLVTYPGAKGDGERAHIDNGNNSLLPATHTDRRHSQLIFWFYLEDVDEDQAPTRFLATADGQDTSRAVPMVAPGGSLGIFHNYTWHAASDYTRSDGQRYVWKFAYGRADHSWEGVAHYTHVGQDPHFRAFIGSLPAHDRELFRFPPAGHPYYDAQTLQALEEQYPGWNKGGEYGPATT
ncbi:MAG: hypothetical protein GKR89_02615 [Candidatus Latescibacteria bacterium]|nr:hypothetical protein [Candidatus Latescibacterota bacterium]